MKGLRELLALVIVLGFYSVHAKPPPRGQPPKEDLQLRNLLSALKSYAEKKNFNYQLRSNEKQDNSLEKDILSPIDEDEAESQTVLIGNKDVKPKNLHLNKEQEMDDNKDQHPLPPVVGIQKNIETRNFGISRSILWTNGEIPYEISADSFGSDYSKVINMVQNTAANISKTTCVKWRPKTNTDKHFVKITGVKPGCYSFIGNIEKENGQILNLGRGCLDEYIVLHEMHHAMGGYHEQNRNKRKHFVKINWNNIYKNNNDQYALRRHTKNNDVYDYASILQYHLSAFSSNGKATMTIPDQDLIFLISESKYDLSFYDMAEINNVYNCPSAKCTISCQNEGFRMQAVDQTTCRCHCPTGLKGPTCEELDTDEGCGKPIVLSNGGTEEIQMASYFPGRKCTWLVKAEPNSLIKATVTSIDLPFSSQDDCYHWIELRYYLIGDRGKELCGSSTSPRTFTQINTGKASPFLIRFNSEKHHTPGTGFTVKVEAVKSGCMSFPCKTGSLCIEGSGDGSYKCNCQNGLSGKNCDEFGASSSNFCSFEDDFGTCLFDQDPSSEILWSFNTNLCDLNGCASKLTHGNGYQFLTITPYYDKVQWNWGSKAVLKTTAKFKAADRCLSFEYSIGNYALEYSLTELNVYVEGLGKSKTRIKSLRTTHFSWNMENVSIAAIEDLIISIEGVLGLQIIGVDNISLRPGLCTNTYCDPNPCQNGGACSESSLSLRSSYVCICQTGFFGDLCENKDTCADNLCTNGGTCISGNSSYSCQCPSEFTGHQCETSIKPDKCDYSPCKNGGTCLSFDDTVYCICSDDYTGNTCETLITGRCLSDPCQNGGSCVETNNEQAPYQCDCGQGYPGSNCEGRACQFENEIDPACFLDTDQSSWQRSSEQPDANPIKAYKGNFYLYLNSSFSDGGRNYFFDKGIAFEDKDYCLTFAYYMNGENVGELLVYTSQNDFQEQFKQQGMLGNKWHIAHVNLHLNQLTYIVVQGHKKTSWLSFGNNDNSSIALDDIQLLPHRCP